MPYTVVRLPIGVIFESSETPTVLEFERSAAFAASLAQVEEASHPPPPRNDPGLPMAVFATDQMLAASSMGAAVILSDRGVEYDKAKLVNHRDKYFVGLLAAILQRMVLMHLAEEAAATIQLSGAECNASLRRLRNNTLEFLATGHFVEVATRETLNRFLSLCQCAHRVPESLRLVQQNIADLDAALQADRQSESLDLMALTQSKVEWIEVFLVSFYAAELAELLGRGFGFSHGFLSWGVLTTLLLSVLIVAFLIRPWKEKEDERGQKGGAGPDDSGQSSLVLGAPRGFWNRTLYLIAGLGLFLVIGWWIKPTPAPRLQAVVDDLTKVSASSDANIPAIAIRINRAQSWLSQARDAEAEVSEPALCAAREETNQIHLLADSAARARVARDAWYVACPTQCLITSPKAVAFARNAESLWLAGDFSGARHDWELATAATVASSVSGDSKSRAARRRVQN